MTQKTHVIFYRYNSRQIVGDSAKKYLKTWSRNYPFVAVCATRDLNDAVKYLEKIFNETMH